MYSIVLMAALTANGPDAVAFGHHKASSCYGCSGCCGGCYGCGGWSCSGCCGGCCGGYGGGTAYASYSYGCCGGVSYGCGGHHHSCFGAYAGTSCYGGCYGSCLGCAGQYYAGSSTPVWYGYGSVTTPAAPYHESGNPIVPPPPAPASPPKEAPKTTDGKPAGSAKLIIDAPADAVLFIDEQPIGANKGRSFATPSLVPGQTYYYTVRVETNQNGKPVSETRRVLVRANEMIRESFGTSMPTSFAKDSR